MNKDRAHGGFQFHTIEKMMIIQAYGAWNLECADLYIEMAEGYYNKTRLSDVDLIIDISALEGITPEAALKLNEYNHICRKREMFKSEAFYTPNSKVIMHMATSILKITGAPQVGIADFDTLMQYTSKFISKQGLEKVIPLFKSEE